MFSEPEPVTLAIKEIVSEIKWDWGRRGEESEAAGEREQLSVLYRCLALSWAV